MLYGKHIYIVRVLNQEMPKRSTNFQDLIELIERQLAPAGAKVVASKLLKDSRSGEDREVDIVIETKSGIHPVTIGIEVTEQKRPASSPWIEGISKKHEDLPINKSIAVSRSGFYRPALKKAEAYKIDTLTLREATNLDWKAKIDRMPSVKIISFLLPYLTGATVVFTDEASLTQFKKIKWKALEVFKPSGESRGSLRSILDCLIADKNFVKQVEEIAYTDAGTIVEGEIRFEKGSYVLGPDNDQYEVHSVRFKAKCKKKEIDAELLKGRYRDTAVVLASGTSFDQSVQIVFTEQKDGESPIGSVRIKKRQGQ